MASTNPIKIIEVCQVFPSADSSASTTDLSLPLTFSDIFFLKFPPPLHRIFFYTLTESCPPPFFNSVVLPRLKHSLSLTLLHFLPLAGNVTWPPHAIKPIIFYTPNNGNNGVSLTVAESNVDFDHLSSNEALDPVELHPYVPELSTSHTMASIISLQVTLFPNKGFSIGYAINHAVLDGKSIHMFMKAWAYLCKHSEKVKQPSLLLPELMPFFDRTVIKDPQGLDMDYLSFWLSAKWPGLDPNYPQSVKLLPARDVAPNTVVATFMLSREDIKQLREKVLSQMEEEANQTKPFPLSTFVLTFAYTLVCIVKAKGIESNKNVRFGFAADLRARLNPPIPMNYFGNCITFNEIVVEAGAVIKENGVAFVAQKVSEVIKGLEKEGLEREKEKFAKYTAIEPGEGPILFVGSTRFDAYGVDFGWGRPSKVVLTTIDRGGAVSMTESKDGSGGVEISLGLKKHEMDIFDSLFVNGLKNV